MLHWEILLLLMFSAVDLLGEHSRVAVPVAAHVAAEISLLQPGLEKTVFFCFKPAQGFLGFFVFLYICPEEKVFKGFSVSRVLLGASRL
jgi:hypothetical protein